MYCVWTPIPRSPVNHLFTMPFPFRSNRPKSEIHPPPSYETLEKKAPPVCTSSSDKSSTSLAALWARTQRDLDLPNASAIDHATLNKFYARVKESGTTTAWRLLSMGRCVTAETFYTELFATCELPPPRAVLAMQRSSSGPAQPEKTTAGEAEAEAAAPPSPPADPSYVIQLNYAFKAKDDQTSLELRAGHAEDYKVFMTLLCRMLPEYVKLNEVPVVWRIAIAVSPRRGPAV